MMQKTLTLKIASIVILSLLLLIPLALISGKIDERAAYQDEATYSVSRSWTGRQSLAPGLIHIPVTVQKAIVTKSNNATNQVFVTEHLELLFIPENIDLEGVITTSFRKIGIYEVPVYTAQLTVSGSFNSEKIDQRLTALASEYHSVDVGKARFVSLVSDTRGINAQPELKWQAEEYVFSSDAGLHGLSGIHVTVPIQEIPTILDFSYQLNLRGMELMSIIPSGLQTSIKLSSDWPHPQFVGDFLPLHSDITDSGYTANWLIGSLASNIAAKFSECESGDCGQVLAGKVGVNHINPVDIYALSDRSVKYGILFIGLCFITFFIFETVMKLSIHPIQYGLVGLANAVFYLLLIALSETMAFMLAYAIASIACVTLIFIYLNAILPNKLWLFIFVGQLSGLYTLLYTIINMENFALLMGSILTFAVLATLMTTTRNIDWYQLSESNPKATKTENPS